VSHHAALAVAYSGHLQQARMLSKMEFKGFENLARDHHLAALPGATGFLLGWGGLHGRYDVSAFALS
jgi:hypothetical protein